MRMVYDGVISAYVTHAQNNYEHVIATKSPKH